MNALLVIAAGLLLGLILGVLLILTFPSGFKLR